MSSAGSSLKKRKAVVWKESAQTQEGESCKQKDMEVDMNANEEELNFVHSAVSSSAGWHEPKRLQVPRVDNGGRCRRHETSFSLVTIFGKKKGGTSCQRQAMEEFFPAISCGSRARTRTVFISLDIKRT